MKLFNFKKKKELINKKVLNNIIENSNMCQHAIRELEIAGYKPQDKVYQEIIELIAIHSYYSDSGHFINYNFDIIKKLINHDVISPLHFTDDEWRTMDGETCYNIRKNHVYKYKNGNIFYTNAFALKPTGTYSYKTKEWCQNNSNDIRIDGLFEHKDNVLTGAYFKTCLLYKKDIEKGWIPKEPILINCVEVEVSPHNWFMAVQSDEPTLYNLFYNYNINWRFCPCLKGVRLEDITKELLLKAYKEINNQF